MKGLLMGNFISLGAVASASDLAQATCSLSLQDNIL